jgi:hypothetical protein
MKISAIETADAKLECLSLVRFIDLSNICNEGKHYPSCNTLLYSNDKQKRLTHKYDTNYGQTSVKRTKPGLRQGILKGEVSLYR